MKSQKWLADDPSYLDFGRRAGPPDGFEQSFVDGRVPPVLLGRMDASVGRDAELVGQRSNGFVPRSSLASKQVDCSKGADCCAAAKLLPIAASFTLAASPLRQGQ
jgi:hypothetical protein